MKKAAIILLSLLSTVAMADQCFYVSQGEAEKAAKFLIRSSNVQTLCEPCGESTPSNLYVDTVEVTKAGYENYYQVLVNGQGIDLAYTYVNGRNLGLAIGCDAIGVSASIR